MRPLANFMNWGFGRSSILFMSFSCLEGINPESVRQVELNKACNYPHCKIKLLMFIFKHAYVIVNAPFSLVH